MTTPAPRCLRIGMLAPSSNTVLEPETAALAAPLAGRVSVHFGRFRVLRIGLDDDSESQFALEPILAAADLLADAKPDVIAWNGTAASWRGFDTDDALCAAITQRTGLPVTTAIAGFNAAFAALGVRRLGIVTPYTPDVQAAIARNYAGHGIEVVSEAHANLTDNFSFSEITPEEIAEMCRRVAAKGNPDALAVVCTNMRGAGIAAAIEQDLGVPVIDSVAATLWIALHRLGVSTEALSPSGRLFGLSPARKAA